MEMTDLIGPGSVVTNLRITSKKQALQELAKRAAELTAQPERAIFDVLIERERLGTTGVGNQNALTALHLRTGWNSRESMPPCVRMRSLRVATWMATWCGS
jgi:mannitol/fructose-specific phosphotransferase system IIA component (Ntr-type)